MQARASSTSVRPGGDLLKASKAVCDTIILHGTGLLGLFIALSHASGGYNPLLVKTALLDAGAAVIACAWVVKTLETGGLRIGRDLGMVLLPAGLFLVSALVSYFFVTPSRDTSFDEVVCRVPYFVVFAIAALEFRDLRRVRLLALWLLAAACAYSIVGLAQHFNLIAAMPAMDGRIRSTFGNPNFYVGFLVPTIGFFLAFFGYGSRDDRARFLPCTAAAIVLPVAYYISTYLWSSALLRGAIFAALALGVAALCLALRAGARTVTAMAIFLLVTNLLLTSSRSGQIGLSVLLVTFAGLLAAFVIKSSMTKKILLVGGLAAVLIGAMLTGVLAITKSRTEATIERKYFALGAADLIKQRPIVGHGLGTFKNNYPLVKRVESWQYNLVCFEFTSNVYNEFLEIWHDEGVLGLAVFLWLLVAVYGAGFGAVRRERTCGPSDGFGDSSSGRWYQRLYAPTPPVLVIGLMSGTGALLISNIFSLSMRYSATGFLFWAFLGLIAARAIPATPPGDAGSEVLGQRRHIPVALRLAQVAAVVVAAFFVFSAWKYYRADRAMASAVAHSREAYRAADQSGEVFHDIFIEGTRYLSDPAEWELAVGAYLRALRDNPHFLRARYFLANSFSRRWNQQPISNPHWGDRPEEVRTDAQRALEQYAYILRQAPGYIEIDYEMGDLYMKLGEVDKAIECYHLYKKHRPFFTKIHTALAQAYAAKGDWTNAAEAYKDAIDLNKRFVLGYCELSYVYGKLGDSALAQDAYERAQEVSAKGAPRIMSGIHARNREWAAAAEHARRLAESDSMDPRVFRDLGWYCIQSQQWDRAIAAYERATRLDSADVPSLITLSNLYYQGNRLDESKQTYQRALAVDPAATQRILEQAGRR